MFHFLHQHLIATNLSFWHFCVIYLVIFTFTITKHKTFTYIFVPYVQLKPLCNFLTLFGGGGLGSPDPPVATPTGRNALSCLRAPKTKLRHQLKCFVGAISQLIVARRKDNVRNSDIVILSHDIMTLSVLTILTVFCAGATSAVSGRCINKGN